MPEHSLNPYQGPTDHDGQRNNWSVDEFQLLCPGDVELPKICYSTLEASDLLAYDVKLRSSSNMSAVTWRRVRLRAATFAVAGVLWYGSRQMKTGSWLADLLSSSSGSLLITFAVVALLIMAQVASRILETPVRLRLYESRGVAQERRRTALPRKLAGAGTALVGTSLVYLAIEYEASGLLVALAVLVPVGIGVAFERWLTPGGPRLVVTDKCGGMFTIAGLSPEYLAAINELTVSKAVNHTATSRIPGGSQSRDHVETTEPA